MSARKKLNNAYVTGGLIVAAVFGLMAQSWLVFFILLALSIVANYYEGNIRPRHHREEDRWKRQH